MENEDPRSHLQTLVYDPSTVNGDASKRVSRTVEYQLFKRDGAELVSTQVFDAAFVKEAQALAKSPSTATPPASPTNESHSSASTPSEKPNVAAETKSKPQAAKVH